MSGSKGSILITGANGGLGAAIVARIVSSSLGKEYHGIYTVRNPKTPNDLTNILRKASAKSHTHDLVKLDLASLASAREAASTINKRVAEGSLPRIRALILNAGYQDSTELTMTKDGFETSFQVNHLSHFLFTLMLLESLDSKHGRIVVVGSWSHDVAEPRNDIGNIAGAYHGLTELFTDTERLAKGLWSTPAEDPTNKAGYRRYGASKLCEIIFMYELQHRLSRDPSLSNISVLGVDPGGMGTGLLRNNAWFVRTVGVGAMKHIAAPIATRLQPNGLLRTTSKSAADVLRASFDTAELGEYPKALYLNGNEEGKTNPEARDEKKRTMLWEDSVRYANLKQGETVLAQWQ